MDKLLQAILTGSESEAFEAAYKISDQKPVPLKRLIQGMRSGLTMANCEAAAYALVWVKTSRKREFLESLLDVAVDSSMDMRIRSQALEGIGMQCVTSRHSLWPRIINDVRSCFEDTDASITFWACYAAGVAEMLELKRELRKLSSTDKRICPGWWSIAEEASDALDWFDGKATPNRTPSSLSKC